MYVYAYLRNYAILLQYCSLLIQLLFLLESSYFRGRKLLIHNHESAELLGIGWGRISFGAVIN